MTAPSRRKKATASRTPASEPIDAGRVTLPVAIPSIRPPGPDAPAIHPAGYAPASAPDAVPSAEPSDAERPTLPAIIAPPPRARGTDATEDTLKLRALDPNGDAR